MDLSPEDDLRLNVLLANDVHAIRIDESKYQLHALTAAGETTLKLNPNTRAERYLKTVREILSSHYLDSPAGYPIYLRRWTRMGDITASNLESLLKIGEPEAVIAVVRSPNLSEEVAARAWWAMPNSDNARRMLGCPAVAASPIAMELAAFLVEFLPYEEQPNDMIESVRLILMANLADETMRTKLWKAGARKAAIRVGFLKGAPTELNALLSMPCDESLTANWRLPADFDAQSSRIGGPAGQAFILAVRDILKQLNNPETVSALLDAVGEFFGHEFEFDALCISDVDKLEQRSREIANELDSSNSPAESLLFLGGVSDSLAIPIFAKSDAVGRVMRRQIEPITMAIDRHLESLLIR